MVTNEIADDVAIEITSLDARHDSLSPVSAYHRTCIPADSIPVASDDVRRDTVGLVDVDIRIDAGFLLGRVAVDARVAYRTSADARNIWSLTAIAWTGRDWAVRAGSGLNTAEHGTKLILRRSR